MCGKEMGSSSRSATETHMSSLFLTIGLLFAIGLIISLDLCASRGAPSHFRAAQPPQGALPGPVVCSREQAAAQARFLNAAGSKCPGHAWWPRFISAALSCTCKPVARGRKQGLLAGQPRVPVCARVGRPLLYTLASCARLEMGS